MNDFPPGVGPGFPSKGLVKGPKGSDARKYDERCDDDKKKLKGKGITPRKDIRQDIPGWGAPDK